MYAELILCVKVDKLVLSDYFYCNVGTREGFMFSSLLFILFLNELININDKHS